MIKNYKKNLKILEKNHIYTKSMEHDACGVGLVASTDGKKLRKIVEHGIEALKAVWHRGASLVVWAIRDGREAAVSIKNFLEKQENRKAKVA